MKTKTSEIILEDIANQGKIFEAYKEDFEGHTFLITGAGGLLGNYMVKLLRYMNANVLDTPCKAILLDNFVTVKLSFFI